MVDGLRAFRTALESLYHQFYLYVWSNIAFVLLCVPLVTLPAALSALFRMGHQLQTDTKKSDFSLFWESFRGNFWRAFIWGAAHLGFGLIHIANLIAYADSRDPLIGGLRIIWLGLTYVWIGLLLYTWPIYYEMEKATLIGATRNALTMILKNPLFTFVILAGVIAVFIVSALVLPALALVTFGMITAIANAAVLNRLNLYRQNTKVANNGFDQGSC